jgi:hypothetical protein
MFPLSTCSKWVLPNGSLADRPVEFLLKKTQVLQTVANQANPFGFKLNTTHNAYKKPLERVMSWYSGLHTISRPIAG